MGEKLILFNETQEHSTVYNVHLLMPGLNWNGPVRMASEEYFKKTVELLEGGVQKRPQELIASVA